MNTDRIAELLGPYVRAGLSDGQLQRVVIYIDILTKWNARLNLTAVRDPEEMVTRHFGESFFAGEFLLRGSEPGLKVIDVGSGAGFPGIPLKIFAPGISLALIESQNKKAVFLREVVRALELDGIQVIGARAETVRDQADLVTMRAVERFENVLPSAAALVRPGGRLGLLIGERQVAVAERILDGPLRLSGSIPNSVGRIVAEWDKEAA